MNTFTLALVLALFVAIMDLDWWSELNISSPLVYGIVTGLIMGDMATGFQVGSVCTLMSLGFYYFGGATVPDYRIGSIFGVVAAIETGDYNIGIVIATVLVLLLMQTNILARTINTLLLHAGERALASNNIKRFEWCHLSGIFVWMLCDAVPVFIGVMLKGNLSVISDFAERFEWFTNGLQVMGAALPSVGMALLLSYMDVKNYWPYLFLGFLLFAYLNIPILGIAVFGIAAGGLYIKQLKGEKA